MKRFVVRLIISAILVPLWWWSFTTLRELSTLSVLPEEPISVIQVSLLVQLFKLKLLPDIIFVPTLTLLWLTFFNIKRK